MIFPGQSDRGLTGADYPASYYADTVEQPKLNPPVSQDMDVDVVVVGAGFTGSSAALSLARDGVDVVVLEANRIGFGASGRNGGQIHLGHRRDQLYMIETFGEEKAKELWEFALSARDHFFSLIEDQKIECELQTGLINAVHKQHMTEDIQPFIDFMRDKYGFGGLEPLSKEDIAHHTGSKSFFGGTFDHNGGHVHPLKLNLGIARAAMKHGARFFEHTRVKNFEMENCTLVTSGGQRIRFKHIILACNGLIEGLEKDTQRRVAPIYNYIIATEPLSEDRAKALIPSNAAIADSRFMINYWRLSGDRRLLFGGGESVSRLPGDIAAMVREKMLNIYPDLADLKIEYAWNGTLAITGNRLLYARRLHPRMTSVAGYSGQGVVMAPYVGHVIARSLHAEISPFVCINRFPCPKIPEPSWLRTLILGTAARFFALRD